MKTITPDERAARHHAVPKTLGTVAKCTVASSTLNHPALEKQIVERVTAIDFGAKGTKTYHGEFPLRFVSDQSAKK